jgi:hypothetical protein
VATSAAVEGDIGRIGLPPVRVRMAPGTVAAGVSPLRPKPRKQSGKDGDHLTLKDKTGRAVRPFAAVNTTSRAI